MPTKTEERELLREIEKLISPHLHSESYGIGALNDLCIAWGQAMDSDWPLDCLKRGKEERAKRLAEYDERDKHRDDKSLAKAESIVAEAYRRADQVKQQLRDSIKDILADI